MIQKNIKFKDYFKNIDILNPYQCAYYLYPKNPSMYENIIYDKIRNKEIIHIGNINKIFKPLIFKIDFINFLNLSPEFICSINLDKYIKKGILNNYPDILYDIHIKEILDLPCIDLAYGLIMDSPELNPIYNYSIRKTVISKINFINFLYNHRHSGYDYIKNNTIYNKYNFPNMNENISNSIYNHQKIYYNFPINEENLLPGYGIVRPFRFENEKNIIRRDNYIPGKEMYKPYLLK